MSQPNYSRLSRDERVIIENRLKNGENPSQIARALRRPRSTVWREIGRNSTENKNRTIRVNMPRLVLLDTRKFRGSLFAEEIKKTRYAYQARLRKYKNSSPKYTAKIASQKAATRCYKRKHLLELPEYQETRSYIDAKLELRWSPEQISGRMKREGRIKPVSYVTIYKYIYGTKEPKLRKKRISSLRRRGKRYRSKQYKLYNQTARMGHSIHDRPSIVDRLERAGDLEGDTIVGKDQKDRLLTHNDRLTGIVSISLVRGFNAYDISRQTTKDLKRVFGETVKTITYDNGVEFSDWQITEANTNATIYFADPYTPSQRGRNENTNGLIRDFLSKGTDFKKVTKSDILEIELNLNNRPRKRLDYLTPTEYAAKVRDVALEA